MHIHTFFGNWVPGGREVTLPLFLANGVTGVRDMGSDLEPILAARRDVASGALLGPRMIVSGPMLDGPKSQFPAADRDRDARGRPPRRGHAQGPRRRLHQDPVLRPARGLLRDRRRVPQAARSRSRATCRMRSAPPRRADAGQKSFEHLIGVFEGSSTVEDAAPEGAEGAGAVPRDLRRRPRGRADPAPREEADLAVPHALLGARAVARRRDRRVEGPGREVRARLLAREELAEVHGGHHQGPRHGSPAGPREVRRARARRS